MAGTVAATQSDVALKRKRIFRDPSFIKVGSDLKDIVLPLLVWSGLSFFDRGDYRTLGGSV